MNAMRVAIVGATGAVGRTMLGILEEREFPVDELTLLASERTAGTRLRFRDREHTVGVLSPEALEGVDLALSSCGSAIAQTWVPQAAERGTTVVDNSSAFRMEPWAELVIPRSTPRPSTRREGVRRAELHDHHRPDGARPAAPRRRPEGAQPVLVPVGLGRWREGRPELAEQVEKLHGMEDHLANPEPAAPPVGEVFGKTIAYNVLAKIDVFDSQTGFTFEEIKVQREGRKRSCRCPSSTSRPRASGSPFRWDTA